MTVAGLSGLYGLKPRFVRRLRGVEDRLVGRRVSADALTASAVIVSAGAGLAMALGAVLHVPSLWLAVPPLILSRLAMNALDGSVARRTGTARPFGAALNEVGDRISDAFVIGGTAFAVGPALAMGAVAASFLASLTGLLGLDLAGHREAGGPMGKADRMAIMAAAAAVAAMAGSPAPLAAALVAIIGGCVLTAALRLRRLGEEI
jgi:CDP-diacylglycerol--glycerol-3-phosphate 3-phosphatidyltransferase